LPQGIIGRLKFCVHWLDNGLFDWQPPWGVSLTADAGDRLDAPKSDEGGSQGMMALRVGWLMMMTNLPFGGMVEMELVAS
jgi:hypothetical protein